MSRIGVVIIGRNEGQRLQRCLASVIGSGAAVVYVDSGSSDGSLDTARALPAEVVALDMSRPFTAARARNAGFERMAEIAPDADYVQFVDGDCEIVPGWMDKAVTLLDGRPDVAALSGRIRERSPEASIYNRLTELEWNTSSGEVDSCAGVSVMRISAFKAAGGFDPGVAAGEEPELCQRMRKLGHRVLRVPDEMALHDVAMRSFGQFWKRQMRGGYGALDVAARFGQPAFKRQVRSARIWALAWPMALLASTAAAGVIATWWAALMPLGMALLFPLQMLRIARHARKKGQPRGVALAYGWLMMVAKFAAIAGQLRYWRDRRAGVRTRLIEHKDAAGVKPTPAGGVA
jgi:glycosyltransferase involved in cell wall biosynthesis